MKYFSFEESPYITGYFTINPNWDNLPLTGTIGSYNILAARLFNLSYAEFLRMCRDKYGAELRGKGTIYGMAYFPKDKKASLLELIKELNKRAERALSVYNF